MHTWKPREIIINKNVIDDPVTQYFLHQCPDISTQTVTDERAINIVFEMPYRFIQGVGWGMAGFRSG